MIVCDTGRPEFYCWTEPLARKRHKCVECSAPIEPGEKYFQARMKFEGRIYTVRQHLLCCEACMLARKLEGECICFGALRDWYGEYRNDLPRHKDREAARLFLRLMVRIRRRERAARGTT